MLGARIQELQDFVTWVPTLNRKACLGVGLNAVLLRFSGCFSPKVGV